MARHLSGTEQSTATAAVGARLGSLFKIEAAPSLQSTSLRAGQLAVTRIASDDPVMGLSGAVPREDAYLLCLLVKDMCDHEVWENGRPFPRRTVKAGDCLLRDLKREQAALIDQPHDSIHFYLPRAALNDLAEDCRIGRVDEFPYRPGVSFSDPVIRELGAVLAPALRNPEQVNRLFLEHVLVATGCHFVTAYGNGRRNHQPAKGGLAGWQERRAKEMLNADLRGAASLRDLADACDLSVSHFSRAFKTSTGVAPHRWLMLRRIEAAKIGLMDRRSPLADIALACGFADQSHLTRVFTRFAGVSPGVWRRLH